MMDIGKDLQNAYEEGYKQGYEQGEKDALYMAIEALSEETSTIQEKRQLSEETPTNTPTDLISRQDAIDTLKRVAGVGNRALDALKNLPSEDRAKGEWIHTPNGIDRDFVWWACFECGHKIFSETVKDRIEFHAYCGRCGAYMRGDTERC